MIYNVQVMVGSHIVQQSWREYPDGISPVIALEQAISELCEARSQHFIALSPGQNLSIIISQVVLED